ncbi:MAG: hypothetical protein MJ224_04510, partial [archaeon]|nr:hypothetical protein [archaeon]
LMIVLLISVMLLSIPCATAASFSDLFTASVSPEYLEIADSNDVPSLNMRVFVLDKKKINKMLEVLLKLIKERKTRPPVKPPVKPTVEPQGN